MIAPSPHTPDVLSAEEISAKLDALSDADNVRLFKIARYYSKGHIDPDDLLHKACIAALNGKRKCPADLDLTAFLAGTMRSLASSAFKSIKRSPETHDILHSKNDEGELPSEVDHASTSPSPEEILILKQEVDAILALFVDDELARLILEGIMENMDAKELQELTGLDKTSYETKRKLIRRRITRAFPKGYKQ